MPETGCTTRRNAELACQTSEQFGLAGSRLGKHDDGTAGLNQFVFGYSSVAYPQTSGYV